MLTIRKEQMAAFQAAQRHELVRRLAAQARAEYPAEVAAHAAPTLERIVDDGLRSAVSLGYVVLADQMRFALLSAAGRAPPPGEEPDAHGPPSDASAGDSGTATSGGPTEGPACR